MSAFFFGPTGRQLFGCFHPARGIPRGATLICPSWGPEYQYAHRALRVLAKRLSERGTHVLRFDYSGTGDSWGETTDASFGAWLEDVHLACAELRARTGLPRVDLVGLRLGAAIACSAAARREDLRRLILWDPVTDGAEWTAGHGRWAPNAHLPTQSIEFAQRLVSSRLMDDFTSLGPGHFPAIPAGNVLLLRTEQVEGHSPLPGTGVFPQAQMQLVADARPWLEDYSIWSGQVPAKVIRVLVDWICA